MRNLKKVLALIFVIGFWNTAFSQELQVVSDNELTETTHALTLKYIDTNFSPSSLSDEEIAKIKEEVPGLITEITTTIQAMDGITKVSFDRATNTFTIIKTPVFILPEEIRTGEKTVPVANRK